jgi:hypothetical protein
MRSSATNDPELLNAAAAPSGDVLLVEGVLNCGARVTNSWLTKALYYIENGKGTSLVLQSLLDDFCGNAPTMVAFTTFIDRLSFTYARW